MLISVASQSVCQPQAQAGDGLTCCCVREIYVSCMQCRCSEKKMLSAALVYVRPSWPNAVTNSERQACCGSRMEGDFGERAAKTTPATVLITYVALGTTELTAPASTPHACMHACMHPYHSIARSAMARPMHTIVHRKAKVNNREPVMS